MVQMPAPRFTACRRPLAQAVALLSVASLAPSAIAQTFTGKRDGINVFLPNNLVVSRSVYDNNAANVSVGGILPPGCAKTSAPCAAGTGAPYNGEYPYVFNNDTYDGSFGITARIFLDQLTLGGLHINSLQVPNSQTRGITASSDQLVTSFSSKSELALHLSTDNQYLTFMGYVAPVDALDVSNSNTPLAVDPTNNDGQSFYRAVARVGREGNFTFTEINAYSGNNGRAAILNDSDGAHVYYTAGNAGNGANPQPDNVILGAGAQYIVPATVPEYAQNPGPPTPLASFSVTQLGQKADKLGKDDNFRSMAIFNNVLYYIKGSGGNGVNTVYFVDTTGKACPNGVGLPVAGAALPTAPLANIPAQRPLTSVPNNMCILAGFPTALAKTANPVSYPFGIWFADSTTLYVADEGDGYAGDTDLYTHAATQTTAGLQKWIFNATTNTWKYAYTLTKGLNLGIPYTVIGYPSGTNPSTGLPWAPATDGLRNITGYTGSGRALIWAITSTVSGNGDQGADPNRLVLVEDVLANTDPAVAARYSFQKLSQAGFAEVLRGVAFTPGSDILNGDR